jgi:MFS family permease
MLGVTNALDVPARQAIVVELVGREDMHSGIALNSIMNSLGRILGPAAAGIALVQFGTAWCFLLNGLSFVPVLGTMFLIKVPYAIKYVGTSSPMRQLREGVEFARRDPLIPALLLLAGVAGLLVLPILRLLPAVADVILHSPEEAYAALSVGEGTGALIAGIIISGLSQRFGHGKLLAVAITVNALANALLGITTNIPLAVLVTSFFGGSMIMLFVSLNTVIQTVVPDNFRGRVLSLYTLAMIGTTPFGSLALGAIAERIGTANTLILNGILIAVLGGAILLRWPDLLRYRTKADVVAMPEEAVPAVGD